MSKALNVRTALPLPRRGPGRPKKAPPQVPPRVGRLPEHKFDLVQAYKLRVANRLSFAEIAQVMKVSKSTVHAALRRLHAVLPDPELVQAYEEVEPYLLTAAKERLLRSLMDETAIKKASLNNRAFSFSQVANHERLVKNQSNLNIGILAKLVVQSEAAQYAPDKQGKAQTPVEAIGEPEGATVRERRPS